jgi:hypothetical protein
MTAQEIQDRNDEAQQEISQAMRRAALDIAAAIQAYERKTHASIATDRIERAEAAYSLEFNVVQGGGVGETRLTSSDTRPAPPDAG